MHHEFSGERLKKLRKRARLTQAEVIKLTGICEATLYNVENDRRRPYTKTLAKLLNLYQVRISYWKNLGQVLEEPFYGGYITSEAVIGFGSPAVHVGGAAEKAADERKILPPHGLRGLSG